MVTLGVQDISRARGFYERLGWSGQKAQDTVFLQAGGMALVLWGRDKLAADCGMENRVSTGFAGFALAQNVRSPEEVDDIIAAAVDAGAEVTRKPATTFYGGYAGYFLDPDGHAWEIAHNPGFTLTDDSSLIVPDFDAV